MRRSIGDRAGIVSTSMDIGSSLTNAGRAADSRALLTEAHALAREIDRPADEGLAAAYLAWVRKILGSLLEAIRWLGEAVPILEAASPTDLKDALVQPAMAHRAAGNDESACACARRLRDLGAF